MVHSVFDFINLRSFSSLWYWLALATLWAALSHRVLGVPFDLVLRARFRGGEAVGDMVTMTRIGVRRVLGIGRRAGVVLTVVGFAALSLLAVLGFHYGYELAQALCLLLWPIVAIWAMSHRAALRIAPLLDGDPDPRIIDRALTRHRFHVQLLGFAVISGTALWGMIYNFRAYFHG